MSAGRGAEAEMTDQAEFKEKLITVLPRLRRFARLLTRCPDRADDLVQSACLRALMRSHQWAAGSRLDSWLFAIIHSIWKNELRAQHIRSKYAFHLADTPLPASETLPPEAGFTNRELRRAVMDLPEAQRTALMLVYVEGYTYKEAAAILDTPIGTVMSRLARGRLTLAERLNGDSVRVRQDADETI